MTQTDIDPGETRNRQALDRLILFSDAVFAIAITLLIIDVHAPELGLRATTDEWLAALQSLAPSFSAFCLSFLVIGALWSTHHATFSLVARFDSRLIWPNLLLLMSVAILPLTTRLLSVGEPSAVPFAVYSASLLAAGLLKVALTLVALHHDRIAADVSPWQVRAQKRQMWLMPAGALLSLILAFYVPAFNCLGMLLVPLGRRLAFFKAPKADDREQAIAPDAEVSAE